MYSTLESDIKKIKHHCSSIFLSSKIQYDVKKIWKYQKFQLSAQDLFQL